MDQRSHTSCPKGSANGHLQGPANPWGCPPQQWARSTGPLAGTSKRPIQTHDHWGFGQIPNGLLKNYFPTKFY